MPKITIEKQLYATLGRQAEKAGYSGVDEYIQHLLEKAANDTATPPAMDPATRDRLRGLGYIE